MGAEGSVRVTIESPRGSTAKWKFDAGRGVIVLSRPLPAGLVYPYDWGFVAGTRAEDGDPVDAMVLWDCSGYPGVVIESRPVAVLQVDQRNRQTGARERNDRVLVVPLTAARFDTVRDLEDVPERVRGELEEFFTAAVKFEGKDLRVLGWAGAADARRWLARATVRQPARRRQVLRSVRAG